MEDIGENCNRSQGCCLHLQDHLAPRLPVLCNRIILGPPKIMFGSLGAAPLGSLKGIIKAGETSLIGMAATRMEEEG